MLNAFDFVDQLFSGIVAFIYSVASTAARLLLTPSSAPLRLLRRYRNPKTRQISGITTLALAFAGIAPLLLPVVPYSLYTDIDWSKLLPDRQGAFKLSELIPFLAGGVVAAIIIDAAIRAWLTVRGMPRRRRQVAIHALTYAFAFFPVALCAYLLLGRSTPLVGQLLGVSDVGSVLAIFVIPGAILLRGSLLVTATYQRVVRRRPRSPLAGLLRTGATLVTAVLSLSAVWGAFWATEEITIRNWRSVKPATIIYKDCRVDGRVATATVVYRSTMEEPEEVSTRSLVIRIDPGRTPAGGKPAQIESSFTPDVPPVIAGGELLTLRGTAPVPLEGAKAKPTCELVEAL